MRPAHPSDVLQRLHCADGHLSAVIKMIEQDRPCGQVFHQLAAVSAALHAANAKIILDQVQAGQAIILNSPVLDEQMAALLQLQALYKILVQHTISRRGSL